MTDENKPKIEQIENLELNRETVQDLTEQESEEAQGGEQLWPSVGCTQSCFATCRQCATWDCPTKGCSVHVYCP